MHAHAAILASYFHLDTQKWRVVVGVKGSNATINSAIALNREAGVSINTLTGLLKTAHEGFIREVLQ